MNRRGSGRATVIDRSTNRYRDQVRCSRSSYSLCSQTSLRTCTCDTVCSSMRAYTYIYIFAATRYKKRRFVLLSNENALKDANATFSLYAFPFRGTASLALSLSLDQSLPTYTHADTHAHAHAHILSFFFFCKNFYSPFFVSFVYVSYLVCSYCYTLHTTTFASLFLLSNSSLFVTFFFSFSSLFLLFFFLTTFLFLSL